MAEVIFKTVNGVLNAKFLGGNTKHLREKAKALTYYFFHHHVPIGAPYISMLETGIVAIIL